MGVKGYIASPSREELERERARAAFRVIRRHYPEGISREDLSQALDLGDRQTRDAVALASELAAPHGYIVGMDPETGRYVAIYLRDPAEAAREKERATRVIRYIHSYFESTHRRYGLMSQAYLEAYGEAPDVRGPVPAPQPPAQPTIFEAVLDPREVLRKVVSAWELGDRGGLARAMEEAKAYLGR